MTGLLSSSPPGTDEMPQKFRERAETQIPALDFFLGIRMPPT